ncbi:hypothetical protein BKA70DRAFT_1214457 [Coprinopsis sp. MPI-PUGE-AT-0042]|nr:hypothetical protein BKA70DRAFT_1214457 [Coprinopsis sp. MPI-PUGE-AT-0042]
MSSDPREPMHPFYRIPNEIWAEIGCYLLVNRDKAVLLRVSRHIHDIAGYILYRKIFLCGMRASGCLASLCTQTHLTTFYSSQIRELSLHLFSSAEKYLCFPVLARLLADLPRLFSLTIACSREFTPYLLLCLQRVGVIRERGNLSNVIEAFERGRGPVSLLSLPSLCNLVLDCGVELFPLIQFRNLVRLETTTFFSYEALDGLLHLARDERFSRSLEELLIRLETTINLRQVIFLVGDCYRTLRLLGLEQPKLKSKTLLVNLIGYHGLPKLRTLVLNTSDVWPFQWHQNDPESHFPAMEPLFQQLQTSRSELTRISFGLVIYAQQGNGFAEVIDRDDIAHWKSKYCTKRPAVHPQCQRSVFALGRRFEVSALTTTQEVILVWSLIESMHLKSLINTDERKLLPAAFHTSWEASAQSRMTFGLGDSYKETLVGQNGGLGRYGASAVFVKYSEDMYNIWTHEPPTVIASATLPKRWFFITKRKCMIWTNSKPSINSVSVNMGRDDYRCLSPRDCGRIRDQELLLEYFVAYSVASRSVTSCQACRNMGFQCTWPSRKQQGAYPRHTLLTEAAVHSELPDDEASVTASEIQAFERVIAQLPPLTSTSDGVYSLDDIAGAIQRAAVNESSPSSNDDALARSDADLPQCLVPAL